MDRSTINPAAPQVAEALPDPAGIYSPAGLRFYDRFVMGLLADRVWCCPSRHFVDTYREHLRPAHADIGVGTGYCIDQCEPGPTARLALIDLRQNCLDYCARRLERFHPETFVRDAREPILIDAKRFDSIGVRSARHWLLSGPSRVLRRKRIRSSRSNRAH